MHARMNKVFAMTVLQSRLSGMFFKGFGLWAAHAAEAIHFHSHERARQFVRDEHVADVAVRDMADANTLSLTDWDGCVNRGAAGRLL